jgi:hypothetical protein
MQMVMESSITKNSDNGSFLVKKDSLLATNSLQSLLVALGSSKKRAVKLPQLFKNQRDSKSRKSL